MAVGTQALLAALDNVVAGSVPAMVVIDGDGVAVCSNEAFRDLLEVHALEDLVATDGDIVGRLAADGLVAVDTFTGHGLAVRRFERLGPPLIGKGATDPETLARLVQSCPLAVVEVDRGYDVLTWNPAAEALFGWTAEQVLGRRIPIVPDEGWTLFENRSRETFAGRTPPMVDVERLRRDGSTVHVRLATSPVHGTKGQVTSILGFLLDDSRHHDAEVALRAAYELERGTADQLRAMDRAKNDFLGVVSHELRTPLTSIIGFAQTLERAEAVDNATMRTTATAKIVENAAKLQHLLTDLLDLDRLSHGILDPQRAPTVVADVVAGVIEGCRDVLDGRRLHVTLDPVEADIDRAKVERIVDNLVRNACRHTPSDAEIHITLGSDADELHLIVADTGPGIVATRRSEVFEPFKQSDMSPGSGIGLSLVAQFTRLHGGRVWVDDADGGGAAFHVTLPLQAPLGAPRGR